MTDDDEDGRIYRKVKPASPERRAAEAAGKALEAKRRPRPSFAKPTRRFSTRVLPQKDRGESRKRQLEVMKQGLAETMDEDWCASIRRAIERAKAPASKRL